MDTYALSHGLSNGDILLAMGPSPDEVRRAMGHDHDYWVAHFYRDADALKAIVGEDVFDSAVLDVHAGNVLMFDRIPASTLGELATDKPYVWSPQPEPLNYSP